MTSTRLINILLLLPLPITSSDADCPRKYLELKKKKKHPKPLAGCLFFLVFLYIIKSGQTSNSNYQNCAPHAPTTTKHTNREKKQKKKIKKNPQATHIHPLTSVSFVWVCVLLPLQKALGQPGAGTKGRGSCQNLCDTCTHTQTHRHPKAHAETGARGHHVGHLRALS